MISSIWHPPCVQAQVLASISIAVIKGDVILVVNDPHLLKKGRLAGLASAQQEKFDLNKQNLV